MTPDGNDNRTMKEGGGDRHRRARSSAGRSPALSALLDRLGLPLRRPRSRRRHLPFVSASIAALLFQQEAVATLPEFISFSAKMELASARVPLPGTPLKLPVQTIR